MFIESKEKEKASKMKEMEGLAAVQKEIRRSNKIGQGENRAFPCHLLPQLH
jgi:hypothetical protein